MHPSIFANIQILKEIKLNPRKTGGAQTNQPTGARYVDR